MKRTGAILLCVGLLLGFWPVAFAANATVSVRTVSTVKGPDFTLADIAEVGGAQPERVKYLKGLRLGEAAEPGKEIFLTPQLLESRLLATRADFSAITWSVPASFKVITSSQRVQGKLLADLAQGLMNQAAQGTTVRLVEIPADIEVPLGKLELTPELVGSAHFNGLTTVQVTVRADGVNFAKIPVQFEVKRFLPVVVVAENLNAGEILSPRSIRLETMDVGKMQAGYLTDIQKAIGLQARYAITPGTILHERALSRPILVKQGEMVRIAARIGEIEVSANGLAMSRGAAGDLIRVQNLTTKRMLTGRVQDDKSVLVLNQQGSW
jgi:flagella basal body P-ring formation protein FlgA